MALRDRRGLDLPRGHQRAEPQAGLRVERKVVHARDLLDVDHLRRLAHVLLHLHQQVGAAGEEAATAAIALQQAQRVVQRGGLEVLEVFHGIARVGLQDMRACSQPGIDR